MNSASERALVSALQYAELGYPVLPARRTENGTKLYRGGTVDVASIDPDKIRESWNKAGQTAVAVVVFLPPGTLALDLDTGHEGDSDGLASLAALAPAGKPFDPLSWTGPIERSPRGGLHLFGRDPRPADQWSATRATIAPGVETKANRQQITVGVEGSGDGRIWIHELVPPVELPQFPAWLAPVLRKPPPPPRPPREPIRDEREASADRRWALTILREECEAVAALPSGERTTGLNRAAFKLGQISHSSYLSSEEGEQALADAAERCGLMADDGERVVMAAIRKGIADGQEHPRTKSERLPAPRRSRKMRTGADGQTQPDGDASDQRGEAKKQAEREIVYRLAIDAGVEPFCSPDGQLWADVPAPGGLQTLPLDTNGYGLRGFLSRSFVVKSGGPPSSGAMRDAILALAADAQDPSRPTRQVCTRVAHMKEQIALDLGDAQHRVVMVTKDGWRLQEAPTDLRFYRPATLAALPEPVHDAPPLVTILTRLFGAQLGESQILILAGWLVGTFCPSGSLPFAALYGIQGTGKTTMARLIRSIIDAVSGDGAGSPPREPRDLPALVRGQWIPCFDNLSHVKEDLSDALCRLSTGADFQARRLFSDADLYTVNLKRPCILTAILDVATQGDLLDRAIVLNLRPLGENRLPEAELELAFAELRPQLLGAVLDAVVAALRGFAVAQHHGERLADHVKWCSAAAQTLGTSAEKFHEAWKVMRQNAAASVSEGEPLADAIADLAQRCAPVGWSGSLNALHTELCAAMEHPYPKSWPDSPRRLAAALKRLGPVLSAAGRALVTHLAINHKSRSWRVDLPSARDRSRGGMGADVGAHARRDDEDAPSKAPPSTLTAGPAGEARGGWGASSGDLFSGRVREGSDHPLQGEEPKEAQGPLKEAPPAPPVCPSPQVPVSAEHRFADGWEVIE